MVELPRILARRSGDGWVLHMDGAEPSYVRRLDGAVERGRVLMEAGGVPGAEHGAALRIDLGDELNRRVKASTQATADAHKAQVTAAAELRRTAAALDEHGLTGRDIAHVLGVSPQRVSQLLNDRHARG
ncbi:hypothetical protein V1J52_23565 [Streptomyces sp. TRM 70351]|uniref:hypothetical protein n=1 Tax=Streptomyces sp. TRM 70351 TaxID=3116552 RepID=UPI002E7B9717|nr:hypothetical protein [Streptomyces sp. TRM 70351]MEE1931123.1 hypothetical protein [Streptomyces sp. TRM 70351]